MLDLNAYGDILPSSETAGSRTEYHPCFGMVTACL